MTKERKSREVEALARELAALVRRKTSGNPIPPDKIQQLQRKLDSLTATEDTRGAAVYEPMVGTGAPHFDVEESGGLGSEQRQQDASEIAIDVPPSGDRDIIKDLTRKPTSNDLGSSESSCDESSFLRKNVFSDSIESQELPGPHSSVRTLLDRNVFSSPISSRTPSAPPSVQTIIESRDLSDAPSSAETFSDRNVFSTSMSRGPSGSPSSVQTTIERALRIHAEGDVLPRSMTILDQAVFRNAVERISGSETEAREMSLCFLVIVGSEAAADTPDPQYLELDDACPQMGVGEIDFSSLDFAKIRHQLIELAPFAPGGMNQSVIMMRVKIEDATVNQETVGIRIPLSKLTTVRDSHGYYTAITRSEAFPDAQYIYVVWLRPARAIRIYRNGKLVLQSIQLRKTQIRSYRDPDVIMLTTIAELQRRKILSENSIPRSAAQVLEILASLALEFSEHRTGSALYIMSRETLDRIGDDGFSGLSITSMKEFGTTIQITKMPFGTLAHLCKEDGATVIDMNGTLLATQVYFGGSGGRKSTAKHVCCRDDGAFAAYAIVISQDGDILYTVSSDLVPWGEIEDRDTL